MNKKEMVQSKINEIINLILESDNELISLRGNFIFIGKKSLGEKEIEWYKNPENCEHGWHQMLLLIQYEVVSPLKTVDYAMYMKCLKILKDIGELVFIGVARGSWSGYINTELNEIPNKIQMLPDKLQIIIDYIIEKAEGNLKIENGFLVSERGHKIGKEINYYKNPLNSEEGWYGVLYEFIREIIQPLETKYHEIYLECLKQLENLPKEIFEKEALDIWQSIIFNMEKT